MSILSSTVLIKRVLEIASGESHLKLPAEDFATHDRCRGLHSPDSSTRSRVFYLFYRFIREDRNEIPPEIAVSLLDGFRDLLAIHVALPELEDPQSQDMLTEAVAASTIFDSQLSEMTRLISRHCTCF